MGTLCQRGKTFTGIFSIKVIGQFPGYIPINELPQITAASFSIILGGRGQTYNGLTKIARLLEMNYEVPYLQDGYPVGWDNTVDWLRNLGVFLQQEDLAEKAVVQERINYLLLPIK